MDNRNLLINAARAGEIVGLYKVAYAPDAINEGIDNGGLYLWNPITRNADAFALMVTLYLDIEPYDTFIKVNNPDTGVGFTQTLERGADREAATRLAIVNCAAIIGENL